MPDSPSPSPRRRRWFVAIYIAFLALVVVAVMRLVRVEADVWDYYYPELRSSGAVLAPISRDDGVLDVLTLGGSVLLQIESALERRLGSELGDRVRYYHLSTTAHTSRDSLLKYQQLSQQKFDVVILCHGINDVRMNYWPQAQFRDDYTHCPWYESLQRDASGGQLTLWNRLTDFASQEGLGPPPPNKYPLGRDLKTPAAFETNLQQLASAAVTRDDRVVILTMAHYLPENYTRKAFRDGQLDYGIGDVKYAAELWGKPEQVAAGITEHNRRTRAVSQQHENVRLVDLEQQVEPSGRNFSDICHLTRIGQQRVVDVVAPVVVRVIEEGRR
jgi:lysophospholipase L1-like esterase